MNRLLLAGLAIAFCASAHAVTLYDNLTQTYTTGNGDWDGGSVELGSNAGLQVGQRVTAVAGGTIITNVTGRYLGFSTSLPVNSTLVQVFGLSGNTVGSLVGQQTSTGSVTSQGTDPVFGSYTLFDVATTVSIGGLTAGSDYLVVLQPAGPNWAYLCRNGNGLPNTFNRDFSSFGYAGGYGHANWTEMGADGRVSGNANMRIEAVPEPTSMAVIGLGVAALLRRRRRSA